MGLLRDSQELGSTYVVERYLGQGSFAEVYRVQHRFLGRQAMKVLKAGGATQAEMEEMLGEALLLSRIGHPNIVRVFDANIIKIGGIEYGYFTMEYVPGGTLDRFWRSYEGKLMPVAEAIEVLKQMCSGIAVAHAEDPPIIHRDIKPHNTLVGYDGAGLRIKISDFGLAKRVNPLTFLASSKGTLSYKPPEAFEDMDSPAADVWALGTTLYLLLTDTLPYPGLEERDLTDGTRFLQELRPASVYNINVNAQLDEIVSRCLAKEPATRYATAQELLQDLEAWSPESVTAASTWTASSREKPSTPALERQAKESRSPDQLLEEALELGQNPAKLIAAADMLEQAITMAPKLREEYASKLKLWRRGMSM